MKTTTERILASGRVPHTIIDAGDLWPDDVPAWHAALAEALANEAPDIDWTVRGPRSGEAEGTYRQRRDGTLQILGYSIPVPDAMEDAIHRAYEQATAAMPVAEEGSDG